jgi:hypothetical protein
MDWFPFLVVAVAWLLGYVFGFFSARGGVE